MSDNYFKEIGKYLQELQSIERIFQSWQYEPTIIPLIDSHEPYDTLSNSHDAQSYRFLDSNRELYLLRADSTLFLARLISSHANITHIPLRLSYTNNIVSPNKMLQTNESQQSGIELVGIPHIAGDIEVILLIYKVLQSVAPQSYRIHIGSHGILRKAIMHMKPQYSEQKIKDIMQYCKQRDIQALKKHTNAKFAELILSIMTIDEFRERAQEIAVFLGQDTSSLYQYHSLIETLAYCIDEDYIRCDFSELGNHDYYTGIVFSAYVNNQGSATARGGRYDGLMNYFGSDLPAVGAALFPHTIMDFLLKKNEQDNKYMYSKKNNIFNTLSDIENPQLEDLIACAKEQIEELP